MIISRGVTRFSPDGTRAACRATDHTGAQQLELWRLTPAGPRCTGSVAVSGEAALAQLVLLDDGRVLHSTFRPAGQDMWLVHPDGRTVSLGREDHPFRLLPAPPDQSWLAVKLFTTDGETVVAALTDGGTHQVARLSGRTGGAAVNRDVLALTVLDGGSPIAMRLDPAQGRAEPLLAPGTPGHVLAAGAHHVLVGVVAAGTRHRLMVVSTPTGAARAVPTSSDVDGTVTPVAVDPDGRTALLTVARGAASQLVRLDLYTGVTSLVAAPPGVFTPIGAWTCHGWWLPFSTPARPYTFGWLRPDSDTVEPAAAVEGAEWLDARIESVPGADGSIEAVVYGPDWRHSDRVVVALHGGPDAHWTLAFDPFFQLLGRAGLAVVAPNQRGSTGYGRAYADAIAGAWGGPDLADIRVLGDHLRAGRDPAATRPTLYGTSYGAFLALLAAAAQPRAWSGCAAIAPFRSAAALHAEAGPAARNLIERLRGMDGDVADLDRLAGRITVPLFIAHGLLDETVPVGQSRELVRRLTAAGREVRYHEPQNRGHTAFRAAPDDPVAAALVAFLTDPARP